MFNLFRRRDKVVRIVLGGLLGIVALSMLLYLIPGANLGSGTRDTQIVAEVGKEPITVRDVQVQLQNMMRNRSIPSEFLATYVPQLVESMVGERAVAYEAKQLGFEVTDADVANVIRSI